MPITGDKPVPADVVGNSAGSDSAPDWSDAGVTIVCPLCEYSLRGLSEPRCPECGHRFEWRDLTDPARQRHAFLFEHHPNRNIRSFLRTALAQWKPRRFWRSVRPTHRPDAKRMVIYWLIVAVCIAIPFSAVALKTHVSRVRAAALHRDYVSKQRYNPAFGKEIQSSIAQHGSFEGFLDAIYTHPFSWNALNGTWMNLRSNLQHGGLGLDATGAAAYLAWPWISALATLVIFRSSLLRVRVRPIHIIRVCVYCTDIYICLAVVAALFAVVDAGWMLIQAGPGWTIPQPLLFRVTSVLFPILVCLAIYRMVTAFRLYLEIDHPWGTVLATQLILALGAFTLLISSTRGIEFLVHSGIW